MNLGLFLKEEQYQTTIYLNDRAYEVLDIGEGECLVVVVTSISEYIENNRDLVLNQRVIVVDISRILSAHPQNLTKVEEHLANDLHLLFDVFWLDKVEVRSEVNTLRMEAISRIANIRNYSSSQLIGN